MTTPSPKEEGTPQPQLDPQKLRIVRIALLFGVVVFGAVVWFMHRQTGTPVRLAAEDDSFLLYGFVALFLGIMVGTSVVRRLIQSAVSLTKKVQFTLVAYAMNEALALFGAVYFLLSGNMVLYLVGLFVFVVSFLLFPIPAAEEAK